MTLVIEQEFVVVGEEDYWEWLSYGDGHEPKRVIKQLHLQQKIENATFIPRIGEGIDSGIWESTDNPQKVEGVTYFFKLNSVRVDLPIYYIPEDRAEEPLRRIKCSGDWEII